MPPKRSTHWATTLLIWSTSVTSQATGSTSPYALEAFESGPLASMMFMKACFPYLKESGHGRVINTASAAGYDGNAGFGAYGMGPIFEGGSKRCASLRNACGCRRPPCRTGR